MAGLGRKDGVRCGGTFCGIEDFILDRVHGACGGCFVGRDEGRDGTVRRSSAIQQVSGKVV